MQEYKHPPCKVTEGKRLGGGGNGIVKAVPDSQPEIAIKFFSVDETLPKIIKSERYRRFCR